MCGRFASTLPPEAIARLFATENPLANFAPNWNLAPSQDAPVVRRNPDSGARHLDLLRWGLLPFFAKDPKSVHRPINARAETVGGSGMFKAAFARRRCLVPASAFYEWRKRDGGKHPYAIARADGLPIAFAGIWDGWKAPDGTIERSFAIVTTTANRLMSEIHDRMPVILEPADWPVWLGEAEGDPAALMRPAAEDVLKLWPVSPKVNSPRNNGADLLLPLPAPGADSGDAPPPGANPA